jgi:hypothetical protein
MNETYKMTFNKIAVYVLTAILSSLSLGTLLAVVEILFFEDSWGFFPTLLVVALYTLPVYFVCAVPFSLFIDYSSKTKAMSAIKKLILFIIAGAVVGFLFGAYLLIGPVGGILEFVWPTVYGMIGSAVFFCLIELLKKWK